MASAYISALIAFIASVTRFTALITAFNATSSFAEVGNDFSCSTFYGFFGAAFEWAMALRSFDFGWSLGDWLSFFKWYFGFRWILTLIQVFFT